MRRHRAYRLLAGSLCLAVGGALALGCSCDEGEFNGGAACQRLVDAANSVLLSCSLSTVEAVDVCSYPTDSCSSGLTGCTPKADVDGCVTAIKVLSCDEVNARGYANATACVDVLSNISSSCAPSDDDDDFDD